MANHPFDPLMFVRKTNKQTISHKEDFKMGKKKPFKADPNAEELNGKIQVEGQEPASTIDPKINAPAGGNGSITEVDEPKSAVNTKRAAEVVTAGSDSSGIGGLRRGAIVFSGSAGKVQGDESATTKENAPYKSGDRAGRRADPITRKVDLLDAEVFENKLYQSKPLSETQEKQGYNGNYHNQHAITQRNSGGAPSDPLFERSVDQVEMDMIYYPFGQYNIAKGSKNLSIHSWDPSANNGAGAYANPTSFTVGNFLTRKLTVKIGSNGAIKNFAFDKTDLSLDAIDEATYRLAGDAYIRNRNQRELDRNVMISKAGNESDPSWSCLGDAIIDSTDQNQILAFVDGMAGAFCTVSPRKLGSALSFQVNKAAKDGSRITGPMAEMVNGCIPLPGYGADGSVSEANGRSYAFSDAAYVKGGAGLWLAVNDSLPKYTTKGKLLSLPLSFKSAYATAISNMAPFVTPDLLMSELTHNELFSTIDGPYDPLKPIAITDKIGLVTPLAIDVGCNFDTSTGVFTNTLYTMHFENYRNKYNINIKNFFVGGIYRWFAERASRLYDACKGQKDSSNDVTIEIPVVSSTTSLSLWDLIVCSSIPYMVEERLTSFTEVLKYEKNFGYPYTGLTHLKDLDIHACDNYSFSDIESPLTTAIAKPVSAMKLVMPEVFWPIGKVNAEGLETGHNGVAAYTVLPHYFVQNEFIYDKDNDTTTARKLVLSDDCATIAYPTVRSGNMYSYFDTIYGMSEEDYRLSLDRMVVYPGYQNSYPNGSKLARATSAGSAVPLLARTYKYGMTADGTPIIPYFAYAASSAHKAETLTVGDILGTPRELGLFQVAPAGVLSPIQGSGSLNTVATDSSYLGLSGPGFRVKIYHGVGNNMSNTVLDNGSVNINANASLRNDWKLIEATPYSADTDIGMKFRSVATSSTMSPFTSGSYSATGTGTYDASTGTYGGTETKDTFLSTYSNFKYLWNRLQRLPFAICPFDCNAADLTSASSTLAAINAHDIYDFLYMFGLAGFRASDFKELIYQRTKEKIAKGMNYVNDPFVDKTFLLK